MIQNEQGEEIILDKLIPYQIFECADTKTDYVVIWTKKGSKKGECILLAFYENATPNRWADTMPEDALLAIMNKPNNLWIYKGYLKGSIFNLRKENEVNEERNID